MKAILLISTIYPRPDGNIGTRVCHYFTKEWAKLGYDVRVIHIQAVYPRVFYWLARMAQKRIVAKTSAVVYTHREEEITQFVMDGVPVLRLPIFKPIPHGAFIRKGLRKAVSTIIENNKTVDFVPDIIIGHFPNPQLELLYVLKQYYTNCKTCEVLHLPAEINQLSSVYGQHLTQYMSSVDIWGFRYQHLKDIFCERFGKPENHFICYSGVPSSYIRREKRDIKSSLKEFVFVGEMIERKYPEKVLDALLQVYPEKNFHASFIGEGELKIKLQERVQKENLKSCISVLGRIPRDNIMKQYDKADCFIMISKGEAYGLVYLEAMARGCITVASKKEGFDGVIIDGENGFLCEAGDVNELINVIKRINRLPIEKLQRISDNAIETAKSLTDKKAAERYLDNLSI